MTSLSITRGANAFTSRDGFSATAIADMRTLKLTLCGDHGDTDKNMKELHDAQGSGSTRRRLRRKRRDVPMRRGTREVVTG